MSMTRKKPVTLSMGVGSLTLHPNQSFEFKPSGSTTADNTSIAPTSIGEIRSQFIDNDRASKNQTVGL